MPVTRHSVSILVVGALMTSVALFAGFSVSDTTVPDAHAKAPTAKAGGAE